ncbi:MAG: extracellular solute-binding protein [Chloroflexi bacterium]|nr:extracellular solute-binding protein [Chloroflexota bacterium]
MRSAIRVIVLALCGLLAVGGGALPMQAQAQAQPEVVAHHAGSLNGVMNNDIGPGFTAATGFPFKNTGGPSVGLANQIKSGQIQTDVFMSADAEVNDQVLMGPPNGDLVRWYFIMCRQKMVVAYSPQGRFAADFEAVRAGQKPWYEALQQPGLVLKRSDPRIDPGGYRGVFTLALAESYYGIPGLKNAVLAGDDNEEQIATGAYAGLKDGSIDAYITYLTNAVENDVPYLELPKEVDQSDPALARFYSTAAYTNPQGQTFRGTPLVYGVTIPTNARNPEGAAAFVRYLVTEAGQQALAKRGFAPSETLVGGDEAAVPESLRGLVRGRYAP